MSASSEFTNAASMPRVHSDASSFGLGSGLRMDDSAPKRPQKPAKLYTFDRKVRGDSAARTEIPSPKALAHDGTNHAKTVFGKHFKIKELCDMWRFKRTKVTQLAAADPETVIVRGPSGRYNSYSIPEHVAIRIYASLSHKPLQPSVPLRNPRRIVSFRNNDTTMSE